MKKIKRITCLLTILILVGTLLGCGNKDATTGGDKTPSNDPITLRYATQHPIDHVAQESAEAIKAEVEEKTEGRIKIEIYPASTLGDFEQMYEELMRGSIDMAHMSSPDRYDARANASLIPYIAYDYDDIEATFGPGSFIHEELEKAHGDQGIKFFGVFTEGFTGVGVKEPLKNANTSNTDKDSLIRCVGFDAVKNSIERLGFRSSTIPYSDTFAAIQTGVVEGWVGGPPNLNYLTFRDVINYYYQYNFFHEATHMMMSGKIYDELSPEDQEIIIEAVTRQSNNSYTQVKEEDEKYRGLLREEGIEVIEFTEEELKAMAEDIRENAWPLVEDKFGKEFMDGLYADVEKREGN